MTLRQRQDQFISDMEFFDNWTDRFNYLISLAEELTATCPDYLNHHRIEGCKSNTCFLPRFHEKRLYVTGWSNSAVMGGLIVAMTTIFNFTSRGEFHNTAIDFHIKSGLIDNLTPMRRESIEEMLRRISVLLK